MSKYRAPKLNLDAGNELCANYQDVFQVIHGINHVKKKKKKTKKKKKKKKTKKKTKTKTTKKKRQQQQQRPTPSLDKDSKVELKAWES